MSFDEVELLRLYRSATRAQKKVLQDFLTAYNNGLRRGQGDPTTLGARWDHE
jgi:hypothetical protein